MKITGNMWNAFVDATGDGIHFADFTKGFEAALAASPTPPAQESVELPKLVAYPSTLIPEEEWRNEPIDFWLKRMLGHCDYHDGLVIKATLTFLDGLKEPAQEAEPVAEVSVRNGHTEVYALRSLSLPHGTKLYTHTSDSLRKAAGEASVEIGKFLDGEECSLDVAHENLRNALKGKS